MKIKTIDTVGNLDLDRENLKTGAYMKNVMRKLHEWLALLALRSLPSRKAWISVGGAYSYAA